MRNPSRTPILFAYFIVILACCSFLWGQSKGNKPRPVPGPCNNDGICQSDEATTSNCGDCNPLRTYGTLDMTSPSGQVFTFYQDTNITGRVYQYKYVSETGYKGYKVGWASDLLGLPLRDVSVGDIDNDLSPEVVAIGFVTRKPKGNTSVYDQRIFIFNPGSQGAPDSSTLAVPCATAPHGAIIADADNDGSNEYIVARGNAVEVYGWSHNAAGEPLAFRNSGGSVVGALHPKWTSGDLGSNVWGLDVGDADNDGKNELVLARFQIGSAQIFKFQTGQGWTSQVTQSLGAENIDIARVRDVDGDGDNEIIAGGTIGKVAIWKHRADGTYEKVFLGPDLGGYSEHVDAADVDGDGNVEILACANFSNSSLFVFGGTGQQQAYFDSLALKYYLPFTGSCLGLEAIYHPQLSPIAGIASGINGFSIYVVSGGQLLRTFNSYYARDLDVFHNP